MYSTVSDDQAVGLASKFGYTSQGPVQVHAVAALFKDQKTVDAITKAPPIVRLFLEEAGFGLTVAEMGDANRPPALETLGLRRTLSDQLIAALENKALKRALIRAAEESEFDVAEFIASVVSRNPDKQMLEIRVSQDFVLEEVPHNQELKSEGEAFAPAKDTMAYKVMPRRPSQLRCSGKGIKSRLRTL